MDQLSDSDSSDEIWRENIILREAMEKLTERERTIINMRYYKNKTQMEIADEIGLFVSEEPGLWWSDMKDRTIVDASLEVLRRTVTRDRNHVSVAFWLSFNECIFTPEFIKESGRVCREYDPYRMVSGANCMNVEMTKKYFKECGFEECGYLKDWMRTGKNFRDVVVVQCINS